MTTPAYVAPLQGWRQSPEGADGTTACPCAARAIQPLVGAEQVAGIVVGQLLAHAEVADRHEPGAGTGQAPAAGRLAGMVEQVVKATAWRQEQVVVELEQVALAIPAFGQSPRQRHGATTQGAVLVGHQHGTGADRTGGEHPNTGSGGGANEGTVPPPAWPDSGRVRAAGQRTTALHGHVAAPAQATRTLAKRQGSLWSRVSGNSRPRPVSGVQFDHAPTRRPR